MRLREIITEMAPPTNLGPILRELMQVLGDDLPIPEIKIINHTNPTALGLCRWSFGVKPDGTEFCRQNTIIFLEKAILVDEKTLRRVLAHELCHHKDFLTNQVKEFNRLGFNVFRFYAKRNNGHGPEWRKIAEQFNAKYGAGFVNERSDESYVLSSVGKPFLVILEHWQLDGGYSQEEKCFAYSVRLSDKQRKYLQRQRFPWKMFKSTDRDFLRAKLGLKGWSVARNDQMKQKWDNLWNSGTEIDSGNLEKTVNNTGEL